MALRPLWIAFQGLTIGLTEIVRAIQGLWPGDEEDEAPVYVFGGGGGGKARTTTSKADRYRAERARIERTNMDLIALTIALAEDYLQ